MSPQVELNIYKKAIDRIIKCDGCRTDIEDTVIIAYYPRDRTRMVNVYYYCNHCGNCCAAQHAGDKYTIINLGGQYDQDIPENDV